jgi:hypothetical protein
LNDSTVLMSGFAAPLRTARPAAETATAVRVAPISLPCMISLSMTAAVSTARSNDVPFRISAWPHVKSSLCPVVFSNSGATCSSTVLSALELVTLISSALAATLAASIIMTDVNIAAAIPVDAIGLITLPRLQRRNVLPRGNGMPA